MSLHPVTLLLHYTKYIIMVSGLVLTIVLRYQLVNSAPKAMSQADRNKISDIIAVSAYKTSFDIKLYEGRQVNAFYKNNDNKPAWVHLVSNFNTGTLAGFLAHADDEGLVMKDYHLPAIKKYMNAIARWYGNKQYDSLAGFDILLTDACLAYAADVATGQLHGAEQNVNREENVKTIPFVPEMKNALDSQRLNRWLMQKAPENCRYSELKEALLKYRGIADAGGLAKPGEECASLKPGDHEPGVGALKKYLKQTGDYNGAGDDFFDAALSAAISKFQLRWGLHITGLADAPTIKAMQVPAEEICAAIAASMERLRWLPQDLGQGYVMVNIADFTLQAMKNYNPEITMKIIVGKPFKQTPVFHAHMRFIVLNPSWDVPKSIMTEEMLPVLRKDPGYLARNHMKLFSSSGTELNPYRINWWRVSPANFSFRIKQTPGDWNALGRIKFLFPNAFSVYLHGTPDQKLFDKDVRTFSHGCMRVQDPMKLAIHLLKLNPEWDSLAIKKQIDKKEELIIPLKQQVPVHITYFTAWIDGNDRLCLRPDVYDRDTAFGRYYRQGAGNM